MLDFTTLSKNQIGYFYWYSEKPRLNICPRFYGVSFIHRIALIPRIIYVRINHKYLTALKTYSIYSFLPKNRTVETKLILSGEEFLFIWGNSFFKGRKTDSFLILGDKAPLFPRGSPNTMTPDLNRPFDPPCRCLRSKIVRRHSSINWTEQKNWNRNLDAPRNLICHFQPALRQCVTSYVYLQWQAISAEIRRSKKPENDLF